MSFFQRLYRASIWHPDAIPVLELKYAAMKRRLLPAVDLVCIYMGVWGSVFGLPSVDMTYGGVISRVAGAAFAVFSFAALVGIAFVRLYALEIIAKALMIGCLLTYGMAVVLTTSEVGEASRMYVLGLITIAILLVLFRLSILRHERSVRKERAERGEREDLGL